MKGHCRGLMDGKGSTSLNFLSVRKKYTATVYHNDEQDSIRKRTLPVKRGDHLPFDVKGKGWQALIIEAAIDTVK